MRPLKKEHKIFVREINKHGDAAKAYHKAYPTARPETARTRGYKLSQKDTIKELIKKQSDKIDEIATKEATEALKNEIVYEVLTATRKKELLRLISEGKMMHKVLKPIWNDKTEKWESMVIAIAEPSLMDRLKAIELHNKMSGDNAPEETKGEMTLTWQENKTYKKK